MNAHAYEHLEVPSSIEAEQALLGAVMMNPDAYFLVSPFIAAVSFFEPLHGSLWTRIADLVEGGRKADPITVIAAIGADSQQVVGDITLREYIARLAASAASIISAPDYAKTVMELSQRRRLITLGQSLAYDAGGGIEQGNFDQILDEAEAEFSSIRHGKQLDGVHWFHEAALGAVKQTAENYQSAKHIKIGMETGLPEIDEMLGPLMGGDLITLAAASGNGKTALVTQMLCAASQGGLDPERSRPSFFVSQEMRASQIARRVLATWTGISTRKQRAGDIDASQYEELETAARSASMVKILFDDSGAQRASSIVRKARAMKRLHNIGAIAVDHLLLLKPEHPRDTDIQTVQKAVALFKDAAKELDVVFFQLAQLTRESQKANTWKFTDQALFGGDAIKQNSDVILGLALPSKWLRQRVPPDMNSKEGDAWMRQQQEWKGKAAVGTLKVRDGDDGDWRSIDFDGARMTFGTR